MFRFLSHTIGYLPAGTAVLVAKADETSPVLTGKAKKTTEIKACDVKKVYVDTLNQVKIQCLMLIEDELHWVSFRRDDLVKI
jgi:hypothetical protein